MAELAGGIVAGLLLAWLGGLGGAALGSSSTNIFGDLIGALLGTFAGYVVGVAAGLSIAGRLLKQGGSFWLALLGSTLGGVLVALLAEPLRLNQNTSLLGFSLFFAALALALVGYNLRRRS
jgi:hypothetical protein